MIALSGHTGGAGHFGGRRIAALVCCALLVWLQAAFAVAQPRMEIIVSRDEGGIELYLAMPTDEAVRSFGLTESDLTGAEGFVDFDGVLEDGIRLSRVFWQGATARLDGREIAFEPLSLMVHPVNRPLPFRTPQDAAATIEVCSDEKRDTRVSATRLYVGLVARGPSEGPLTFEFPAVTSSGLTIRARDFTKHRLQEVQMLEGGATGVVLLQDLTSRESPLRWVVPVALVSGVLVLFGLVGVHRKSPGAA